jgi:hypothetical protein
MISEESNCNGSILDVLVPHSKPKKFKPLPKSANLISVHHFGDDVTSFIEHIKIVCVVDLGALALHVAVQVEKAEPSLQRCIPPLKGRPAGKREVQADEWGSP